MEQLKKHPAVRRVSVVIAAAAIAVALVSALGCTSKPGSESPEEKTTEQGPSAKTGNHSVAAQSDADPGINLNCIYDRLKDPPESFHYVYKKNDADGSTRKPTLRLKQSTVLDFSRMAHSSRFMHSVLTSRVGKRRSPV